MRQIGMRPETELNDQVDALLRQHRRHRGLDARPGDCAIALHLVAVHREIDFARARIAGDDFEFSAEGGIGDDRERVGGASRSADDQLGPERILERLHQCIGARDHHLVLAQRAADPGELAGIEPSRARVQHRARGDLRIDRPDDGAVPRRDGEDVVGDLERQRPRHILRHDIGIAGDVPRPMRRNGAGEQVVAAAGA
jgi:hypothetical protein